MSLGLWLLCVSACMLSAQFVGLAAFPDDGLARGGLVFLLLFVSLTLMNIYSRVCEMQKREQTEREARGE